MSPFAAIVRLAFAEKGLTYQKRELKGRSFENLEPWFANINAKMQVPSVTITSGDEKTKLTDSRDIIAHIEEPGNSEGRPLVDPARAKETWSFVDSCYEIKPAAFYAKLGEKAPGMAEMMQSMREKKKAVCVLNSQKYPELKEAYLKKVEADTAYATDYMENPEAFVTHKAKAAAVLAKAEELLNCEGGEWLFGSYSIADVVLTCYLSVLNMMGMGAELLAGKPGVAAFWAKAKGRPSYAAAGVMDSIPLAMKVMMLPMMLFFRAKKAIMLYWSKGMEEADKKVAEV